MTENAGGVESAEAFVAGLHLDIRLGVKNEVYLAQLGSMVRERDALIRKQTLREVADALDITARWALVADYEHWIDARNVVRMMLTDAAQDRGGS